MPPDSEIGRRGMLIGSIGTLFGSPAAAASGEAHIALLGDSVFDNGAYVPPADSLLRRMQSLMPAGWQAALLARDGAVIAEVVDQLSSLPAGTTHLVISAGGNDALGSAGVLREPASSVAASLARIADIRDRFSRSYGELLEKAADQGLPLAVCTIYDAQLPDPSERRLASTALAVLNDVILREASARRLPVVDLRVAFDSSRDYANAIEPSGEGAAKIAAAIIRLVERHDFAGPASLYGSGP